MNTVSIDSSTRGILFGMIVDRFIWKHTLYFFKVSFSTFWFKFGATLRRQAERSDSEARRKAPNIT